MTVTAYASWIDDQGNVYVSSPGKCVVTFFVRVPTRVNAVLDTNPNYTFKVNGPPNWGHATKYDLKLIDNQSPAKPYTNGGLTEVFSNIQYNPVYAYDLQHPSLPYPHNVAAPGLPAKDIQAPNISDNNGWSTAGWTNPPPGDTGDTTLWYQFDQTVHCMETAPGYTNDGYDTPLNTYTIYVEQGQSLRSPLP